MRTSTATDDDTTKDTLATHFDLVTEVLAPAQPAAPAAPPSPLDLKPEESAMWVDTNNNLLFLVICNFCEVDQVREWCDGIIREHVGLKHNVRVCLVSISMESRIY